MRMTFLLIMCIVSITLTACTNTQENNDESIRQYCSRYAIDYEIIENKEDGWNVICIDGPDFGTIAQVAVRDSGADVLSAKMLKTILKEHPELKKQYIFEVDEISSDNIERVFLQQVTYEMMVSAIENIEYSDEWSERK